MSIIREIKAAFRWVFNIKNEVKQEIEVGDIFEPTIFIGERVIVVSLNENLINFREKGCVGVTELRREVFLSYYRRPS
jgi:hypothetical protein